MIGKYHTEETKEKMKSSQLKRYKNGMPEEHKKRIGKANSIALRGNVPWNKGKKHSEETKRKMRENHADYNGSNHPNWQGGKSFEPYGLEFNENLREVVRNRDRRRCIICEKTELDNKERLVVHHADYDKQNNNPNNLFSLCRSCHIKTNYNRKKWIKYFQKLL